MSNKTINVKVIVNNIMTVSDGKTLGKSLVGSLRGVKPLELLAALTAAKVETMEKSKKQDILRLTAGAVRGIHVRKASDFPVISNRLTGQLEIVPENFSALEKSETKRRTVSLETVLDFIKNAEQPERDAIENALAEVKRIKKSA